MRILKIDDNAEMSKKNKIWGRLDLTGLGQGNSASPGNLGPGKTKVKNKC